MAISGTEQLQRMFGRLEVEKLIVANARDRLNELGRDIEELANNCDQAHGELVAATDSIQTAIDELSQTL